MAGWIKIDRGISNHWVWKDASYLKAWIALLLAANHEEKKTMIQGELITCKRGQIIMSLSSLSDLFGKEWSIQRVRTFLKLLSNDSMIEVKGLSKTTRVTICKYDTYQSIQQTINKQSTNNQQATNIQSTTTKEDKELEEGKEGEYSGRKKKSFTAPQLSDVIEYFNLNGYSNEGAEVAFNYYDKKDWVDSKGNKVSNWKLKMQNVWFKDEYKEKPKQLWVKVRLGSTIQDFIKSSYEVALRENKLNCNNPEIIKEYYK